MTPSEHVDIAHHLAIIKAYLDREMHWQAAKHLEDLIAIISQKGGE